MEKKRWEIGKLLEAVERELTWKPFRLQALKRLSGYLHGIEKPTRETLDHISLFVGFQDWESFQKALHGENDAQDNYESDEIKKEQIKKGR